MNQCLEKLALELELFSHLVLEVDGSIEVWDLRIDRLADDFSFAGVKEGSHF
jgi:hypothetical protein